MPPAPAQKKNMPADRSKKHWFEVIEAETDIAKAAMKGGSPSLQLRAIERAQKGADELSSNYPNWMHDDIEKLIAAARSQKAALSDFELERLLAAAQDVRGNAKLFGFPYAALAADALCIALESFEAEAQIPMTVLQPFVDAISIASRSIKDPQAEKSLDQRTKELKSLAITLRDRRLGPAKAK